MRNCYPRHLRVGLVGAVAAVGLALLPGRAAAQDTRILGFADVTTTVNPSTGKTSFALGEWDLFITSDLTDRISFLGETVFKYDPTSGSRFAAGVERIILKYNVRGNHNLLLGKMHTPVNYWNDTYHHGRVFFPTIFRPAVFNEGFVPLHTLGAGVQGQNRGKLRLGYDVVVGNGLSGPDAGDNDAMKSVTLAAHVKPVDGLRLGGSAYFDRIAPGTAGHSHGSNAPVPLTVPVHQQMYTASVAYFGPKLETLIENSFFRNKSDSSTQRTNALYAYAGWRVHPDVVVYGRYDLIRHPGLPAPHAGEAPHHVAPTYFGTDDLQSLVGGVRYEFSYQAVVKLEFQHDDRDLRQGGRRSPNAVTFQFAVGF